MRSAYSYKNVIVVFLITTSTYRYVVQTISLPHNRHSVFLEVLFFRQLLVVEPSIYLLNYIAWLLIVFNKKSFQQFNQFFVDWFFNPSTNETRLLEWGVSICGVSFVIVIFLIITSAYHYAARTISSSIKMLVFLGSIIVILNF